MVVNLEHGSWDQHVLHLLQKLRAETGDGDLLWGHERGQGCVQGACVGQAGERHDPSGCNDGCDGQFYKEQRKMEVLLKNV